MFLGPELDNYNLCKEYNVNVQLFKTGEWSLEGRQDRESQGEDFRKSFGDSPRSSR